MNGAMKQSQPSELEQHARAYAIEKARDVRGEIVGMVLDRTCATIPNLGAVEGAEDHIERRLAALLKNSLVEFTQMWTAELERRTAAMQKIAVQAVASVGSPQSFSPRAVEAAENNS